MRGDDRPQAHLQARDADRFECRVDGIEDGNEGNERRYADHHARHHDGDIDQRIEELAQPPFHPLEAQGAQGAHHGGDDGSGARDNKARHQRLGEDGISESFAIPFDGKALPVHRIVPGIERKDDDERDWRVEEDIDEGCIDTHGHTKAARRTSPRLKTKRM